MAIDVLYLYIIFSTTVKRILESINKSNANKIRHNASSAILFLYFAIPLNRVAFMTIYMFVTTERKIKTKGSNTLCVFELCVVTRKYFFSIHYDTSVELFPFSSLNFFV